MSSYNSPSDKYINGQYNPSYFVGKEDEAKLQAIGESTGVISGDYVQRDGSTIMTGGLMTPSVTIFNNGTIQFTDDSIQTTAFTNQDKSNATTNTTKLTKQSYDAETDTTDILGSFKIRKIIFADDNDSEQVISFSASDKSNITNNVGKLTQVSYDSGLLKTTLNNSCHVNNLTCGNFNTSHLSGTTSNVQTQLNTLSTSSVSLEAKTINMTAYRPTNATPSTVLTGSVNTNFINIFDGYGEFGKIVYPDLSIQTSAYSTTEKTKLSLLDIETYDISKTNITTDKITFGNHEQVDAFSTLEKTKLSWLNIDANELFINQIKYLDNSVQTTAYTTLEKTKLSWLNIDANELFINQIKYLDNSVQTTAYTTSERSKTQHQSATILPGNNKLTLFDGTVQMNQIQFTNDNSVQTTAFTSTKDTLLTNINGRTRNMLYFDDGFNTTQIGGRITTNNIRLYEGNMVYADGTTQVSAFTSTDKTNLENIKYNTQNVIYFNNEFNLNTTQIGGRIVTNNLRLYEGNLGFSDGTIQYSAFTNEYKTKVDSLNNVVGAVQMFAGLANDPTGWMICNGRTLLKSSYLDLFNVIGQSYVGNKTIDQSTYFCIPDMRNLYVRGNAPSINNTYDLPSLQFTSTTGQFKPMQVQAHKHSYIDRGEGSVEVTKAASTGGSFTVVANDTSQNFYTSSETYDNSFVQQNNIETMPNSICMNYIIKY
jgi:microcystin-dependent protein